MTGAIVQSRTVSIYTSCMAYRLADGSIINVLGITFITSADIRCSTLPIQTP